MSVDRQDRSSARARRRVGIATLLALSVPVVSAGLAWACTPAASINITPAMIAPGDSARVSGQTFAESGVRVTWGSTSGQQLATTQGPSFSVPVTIPADAQPGVYYVVATVTAGDGQTYHPSTSVQVVAPQPAPAAPAPASQPEPSAGAPAAAAPGSATAAVAPAQPVGAATPATETATVTPPAHTPPAAATRHEPARATAPTPTAHRPAPATAPASSNRAVVRTGRGREVFGGSVADARPRASAARRSLPAQHRAAPQTDRQSPSSAHARPSLLPTRADPRVQPSSPGAALQLGIGLLGLGLVALAAGALVAAVGRRRAKSTDRERR